MRIYDNTNPEGRKIERPGTVPPCPLCDGRNGRHVLAVGTVVKIDAKGRMQPRKVVQECPNGQVDTGVDAA